MPLPLRAGLAATALLAAVAFLRPAPAAPPPGAPRVWHTPLLTLTARPDGWIELSDSTPERDPHDRDDDIRFRERVTPAQAAAWLAAVRPLLAASLHPTPRFWARAQDSTVASPPLGFDLEHGGSLTLSWRMGSGGRMDLRVDAQGCRGGKGLDAAGVQRFLAALDSAARVARALRPAPVPVERGRTYLDATVSCGARFLGGPPLPAPPGGARDVLAEFVVDAAGRVDASSVRTWAGAGPRAAAAARAGLATWRFEPARVGGVAVAQRIHLLLWPGHPAALTPDAVSVSAAQGWVVVRQDDWPSEDTILQLRRRGQLRFTPAEVRRWVARADSFTRMVSSSAPRTGYDPPVEGPRLGSGAMALRLTGRHPAAGPVLALGVEGSRTQSSAPSCRGVYVPDTALVSFRRRLAAAARVATARPPAPVDTLRAYAPGEPDCPAAAMNENVARLPLAGADRDRDAVLLRFVVDREGSVEPASVEVVSAPSPAAGAAARRLAANWDYVPALVAGRPVRQWTHATVRVLPPGEAPARPYPASRAAVLAAREGCRLTRGPDPADYQHDGWNRWWRAPGTGVEFSCRIEPGRAPQRVVVTGDGHGWPHDLRVYRGAARPLQVLAPEFESSPLAGGEFLSAMDLDADGYRDLMAHAWSGTGGLVWFVWRWEPRRGRFAADSVLSALPNLAPVPGRPCVRGGSGSLEELCLRAGRWITMATVTAERAADGRCMDVRRERRGGRMVVVWRRPAAWRCWD
jgi:TonB family protein